MNSVGVTWGDGSGTGTGGTLEFLQDQGAPRIETWMGAWAPHVANYDSNWRELRTLLWTIERMCRKEEEDLGTDARKDREKQNFRKK